MSKFSASDYKPCMNCGTTLDAYEQDFCGDCHIVLSNPEIDFEKHYNKTNLNIKELDNNARTQLLLKELNSTSLKEHINYEFVRNLLKEGINTDYTDEKGYKLNELAGFRGRYDVAELIYRSTYMEV